MSWYPSRLFRSTAPGRNGFMCPLLGLIYGICRLDEILCRLDEISCRLDEILCRLDEILCRLDEILCRLDEILCRLDEILCRLDEILCRLDEMICRLDEILCRLDEILCRLDEMICRLDEILCRLDEILCRLDEILCRLDEMICRLDEILCRLDEILCRLDEILCRLDEILCRLDDLIFKYACPFSASVDSWYNQHITKTTIVFVLISTVYQWLLHGFPIYSMATSLVIIWPTTVLYQCVTKRTPYAKLFGCTMLRYSSLSLWFVTTPCIFVAYVYLKIAFIYMT